MPTSSVCFTPDALQFLRDLEQHNDREWFQPRKQKFEELVRDPMLALVGKMNEVLAEVAPAYMSEPKKAVYRIYRDTRFSPDKTPYKTHLGAVMGKSGLEQDSSAVLYFHISAKEFLVAGGVYAPSAPQLLKLRQYLAENHKAFEKLMAGTKLRRLFGELGGSTLSRAPKGFSPEHPAIELLKRKQYLLSSVIAPEVAASPALFKELKERMLTMLPVVEFLNAPFAVERKPPVF